MASSWLSLLRLSSLRSTVKPSFGRLLNFELDSSSDLLQFNFPLQLTADSAEGGVYVVNWAAFEHRPIAAHHYCPS